MPTVLITGANRGLGLGFAKHYAGEGWDVIGACRQPLEAAALKKLPRTRVLPLDLAEEPSILALADDIGGAPLDLLINNAGMLGPRTAGLGQLGQSDWLEVLGVNAVGPALLAEALAANVLASQRKLVVNISSGLGSMSETEPEWAPLYCVSKAALNMVTRYLAKALAPRGGLAVALSPGWVQTAMGGPGATLSVEDAVEALAAVIAGLKKADNGSFLGHQGQPIPW